MSYKSHQIGPDRVFDHLYDPIYTTGTKDIWKENHNALYRSAPVRIYPQYGTMFTDLPKRPRNIYIQQRNPLPHFPFVDENGSRSNGKRERKCTAAVLGGRDRAKFFDIPLNNEINMNLQLDIGKDHICCHQRSMTPTDAFRTVACETIYREQSAQTKPWMPDFVVDDKCTETPELLYTTKGITGYSAPGILEVKQIERARRRRQLEKAFARSKCKNDPTMRREFWEALEWEDRVAREAELDYCQHLRLEMVKKMMNSRDQKMQQNFTLAMETTINRLEAEKEKKMNNLRVNHQRTLRRLDKQYGEKCKRSKLLAQEHQQTTFVSYNTDFEARLEDLHKMPTMPTNLERFTQPKIDITKPKQPVKEVKKGLWTEKFLVNLYESLKVIQRKIIHQRTAKCLIDIHEEVQSYVSTIELSVESFSDDMDYQHAVFLQKLIKGRAIQSILHEGKEANQELIDQLKETFKLESVWKAECADDWNEENLMEFLGEYINQEFSRYTEQKAIHDRRMLPFKQDLEREREEQKEQQEVVADCLDKVLADLILPELETSDQMSSSPVNDDSSEIVHGVFNNLILPDIYDNLPDDSDEQLQKSVVDEQNQQKLATHDTEKEEIVAHAIEHILQKVISHPAADITNDIMEDIVKKTVELSASLNELNADSLDKEIGGMLDELCDQLLSNLELNDESDGSSSGNDSPE
ncbi:cilia- and flagella-associated protein 91-like [Bradysia coprophila]|uniref:cilia- and flagella-associated protein 91-like n=1 Tax=Bradysia coprophila TaxID=38358 RepID=UPI00187D96B5|nr:cilia- and flagella-associated protein 91-like [Bradysia coprophila]